jgi:hypothetical protein
LILNSQIFVTKKEGDTFSGYLSEGIFRKDLSSEILSKQINKAANIYDIINLNNNKSELHWCNSIQTKMCLMTIQKNELFSISSVTLN